MALRFESKRNCLSFYKEIKFQWKIIYGIYLILYTWRVISINGSSNVFWCSNNFKIKFSCPLNQVPWVHGLFLLIGIVPWMFFVVLQVIIWEENIAEESHSICEQLRCARGDWASGCFWFMLRYRAVSPVNSDIQWTFGICLSNLLLSIFMVWTIFEFLLK